MTPTELRKLSRAADATAQIISDGCRDYIVLISQPERTETLQDRNGNTLRFKSIDRAKFALRRARVQQIVLKVRVAADEACAKPAEADVGKSTFSSLSLTGFQATPACSLDGNRIMLDTSKTLNQRRV